MDHDNLSIEDNSVLEQAPIIWQFSCDAVARRILIPAALAASFALIAAVTMGLR